MSHHAARVSRVAGETLIVRDRAELSADDAGRITLHAQGFLGANGRRGGVAGMLRRVGAVQLDTISVLARSHELGCDNVAVERVELARHAQRLRDAVARQVS